MALVDVASLLAAVSPEEPCGPDMEYAPQFQELFRLLQTGGGDQDGINWAEVCRSSSNLLMQTKDVRVILSLAIGALKMEGLPGLRDGLRLLAEALDSFWDNIHPQLDPDDDEPALMRSNAVAELSPDPRGFAESVLQPKKRLWEAPLVVVQRRPVTWRDVLIARGEVPAKETDSPLDAASLEAALAAASPDDLQATAGNLAECVRYIEEIHGIFSEKRSLAEAPDLSDFKQELQRISVFVAQHAPGGAVAVAEVAADGGPVAVSAVAPVRMSGEITSREDVRRVLEKACKYFEANEPSSPVPVLLKRALRLLSMNFMEIIRDMSPSGMSDIIQIAGQDSDAETE